MVAVSAILAGWVTLIRQSMSHEVIDVISDFVAINRVRIESFEKQVDSGRQTVW